MVQTYLDVRDILFLYCGILPMEVTVIKKVETYHICILLSHHPQYVGTHSDRDS